MTTVKVRKRDAEKVLAEVRRTFSAYIGPGDEGPFLLQDWGWAGAPAPYAVVWETGPHEWTYLATAGGVDEEMANLAAEFGATVKATEPIPQPDGVFCEPMTGWALGIYPN